MGPKRKSSEQGQQPRKAHPSSQDGAVGQSGRSHQAKVKMAAIKAKNPSSKGTTGAISNDDSDDQEELEDSYAKLLKMFTKKGRSQTDIDEYQGKNHDDEAGSGTDEGDSLEVEEPEGQGMYRTPEELDEIYELDDSDQTNGQHRATENESQIGNSTKYNSELTYDRIEGGEVSFKNMAAKDAYILNAWPTSTNEWVPALEALKKVNNVSPNDTRCYTTTPRCVKLYTKTVKSRRTTFHSQVNKWIHKYQFPVHDIPNMPVDYYGDKHCFDSQNRFAQKNYATKGALLQNTCLADCIRYVLLNDNAGPRRMEQIPSPVPKELMALTYVAICYRMAKFSKHKMYKEKGGDSFKEESAYHITYKALTDPNTLASRKIKWDQVAQMIELELSLPEQESGWTALMMLGEEEDESDEKHD
ncbi:hypothetical protein BJV82DRAFT_673407 [Fennellomyces sp. T-0311]|nr:hypothetical protein BJV82DRAFT_673407 [Fennellomyces sp. T-0311]